MAAPDTQPTLMQFVEDYVSRVACLKLHRRAGEPCGSCRAAVHALCPVLRDLLSAAARAGWHTAAPEDAEMDQAVGDAIAARISDLVGEVLYEAVEDGEAAVKREGR